MSDLLSTAQIAQRYGVAQRTVTVNVPTHTTVSGQPWGERTVAVLLDIGEDDGIPF